ncbi:Protein kinase-like (PK-like) [Glarea lozoyensis ATCC 20868]|uniref:non-specific serine/threonine protein kinase n=1 Tax=Glarea lozoyensis (strain ATCC 20868 / MF5171) TaxID=1116229 RepID=S3DJT8_GLAL2|nr:Protein kinase-like (PK-like) [Glarea lozoyensis ATCC 20868]EPE32291.1 Protein kinase-like (PK-like) [Glarea lozoyensis ATCC 20868]
MVRNSSELEGDEGFRVRQSTSPPIMEWRDQNFRDIREEIHSAMHQGNDENSKFVTKHQLYEIWTLARLESFCRMIEPFISETQIAITIARLRTDLLRTLSILVSIVWDGWQRFPQIFFDSRYSKAGERVDRIIKICDEEILRQNDYLGSQFWAREFIGRRNAFFPITIKHRRIKDYPSGRRLPFILPRNEVEVLGSGASGTVTREKLALLQYKLDGTAQPIVKPVARKVFIGGGRNFKKEKENLLLLQNALLSHERIVPFLSIVSIGVEYNIFSELGVMNLGEFLGGEWYQFQTDPPSAEHLFNEFTGIADALRSLHEVMWIPKSDNSEASIKELRGRILCCHMDLKPENILIYRHPDHPLGVWKISDFGISRIKELGNDQENQVQTHITPDGYLGIPKLGNLRKSPRNLTAHTHAARNSGSWTAPEFHSSPLDVGRKSDVWPLGCILVLLCALSISPLELSGLESDLDKLWKTSDYDVQNGDRFYRIGQRGDVILNPWVKTWTQNLSHHTSGATYLKNCQKLILSALEIDPVRRISSTQLHNGLDQIFEASGRVDPPMEDNSKSSHLDVTPPVVKPSSTETNKPPTVKHDGSEESTSLSIPVINEPAISCSETWNTNRQLDPKGKMRAVSSPLEQQYPHQPSPPGALSSEKDSTKEPHESHSAIACSRSSAGTSADSPGSRRSIRSTEHVVDSVNDLVQASQSHFEIRKTHPGTIKHTRTLNSGKSKRFFLEDDESTTSLPASRQDVKRAGKAQTPIGVPPERVLTEPNKRTQPRLTPHKTSNSSPPVLSNMVPSATPFHSTITPMRSQRASLSRVNSMHSYHGSLHSAWNGSSITDGSSRLNDTGISFRVPLELGRISDVLKCVIPSNNEYAVFLSLKIMVVCPLYDDEHQGLPIELPEGWSSWVSVSAAGSHILARGRLSSTHKTAFKSFEVQSLSERRITVIDGATLQGTHYEDGVISPDGYILYQDQSSIILTRLGGNPRTLEMVPGCIVKRTWFNAQGSWAFAWFVVNGREHSIKTWNVSNPEIYYVFHHPLSAQWRTE